MTYHGSLESSVSRRILANETLAPGAVMQLQAVQNIQRYPRSELLQVLLPLLRPAIKSTGSRRKNEIPRIKDPRDSALRHWKFHAELHSCSLTAEPMRTF